MIRFVQFLVIFPVSSDFTERVIKAILQSNTASSVTLLPFVIFTQTFKMSTVQLSSFPDMFYLFARSNNTSSPFLVSFVHFFFSEYHMTDGVHKYHDYIINTHAATLCPIFQNDFVASCIVSTLKLLYTIFKAKTRLATTLAVVESHSTSSMLCVNNSRD